MIYLSGPCLALAVKTGIVTGILSLTVRIVHYICVLRLIDSFDTDSLLLHILILFIITSEQEGIAVGRTFAAMKNYQVDGNKEMMAIGLMNMAGSCSSCFVTTGTYFTSLHS